jgi:arylsulfatase A-like enzyme
MPDKITRRDFLKLAGTSSLSIPIARLNNLLKVQQKQPNIIIVVFDALSARNISLYGYQRDTMPNLSRLLDRAVVYHRHYASGNYTIPGTASLLTGTFPWTHRAFRHNEAPDESFFRKNIFTAFEDYYSITYTHNQWALTVLNNLSSDVDEAVPWEKLLLTTDKFIPKLFENDLDIATLGWVRSTKRKENGYSYSLFFPNIYERFRNFQVQNLQGQYPRGVPSMHADTYFLLEDAINWVGNKVSNLNQPFLGYFHFWPPHAPYATHQEFYGRFKSDGYKHPSKPPDIFRTNPPYPDLRLLRMEYDESILYVDREFGRLYDYLEIAGLLESTWVIFTSDHGELLERGIAGHITSLLYDPLINIPLVIFEPGRNTRVDIYSPTSAIDLIPTLLHITGHQRSEWLEGRILPPYDEPNSGRNIFALEATKNEKYDPLKIATTALIKDQYKLMYFFGYPRLGADGERIELYDIENDPEELNDLSTSKTETTTELLDELKQKLAEVNEPYL